MGFVLGRIAFPQEGPIGFDTTAAPARHAEFRKYPHDHDCGGRGFRPP
jgi:hypothetical protein